MLTTVYSLQIMPSSVWTAEDASPPPSLEPLLAHLTSTKESPLNALSTPLDTSFICHDHVEWDPTVLIVTCYSNLDSTVPIKVNFFDFARKTPDPYLSLEINHDKQYYLPHDLILSEEEKWIQKVAATLACNLISPLSSTMLRT